jgi:DNA-binding FadR family transcriptional regulator
MAIIEPNVWRAERSSLRSLKKSELLARLIVTEIAERGLVPGDVLPAEAVMLEHYGVGRATLREALRLLETQGLVRVRPGPGGGPVVGIADPANLGRTASLFFSFNGSTYGELGQAMLFVDPWLAELAATQPDRERVRMVMGSFVVDQHVHEPHPERSMHYRDFHQAIRQLSDNKVLKLWGEVIGVLFGNHIVREIDFTSMHDEVSTSHTEIAGTILNGEATRARELMLTHTQDILDFCAKANPGFMHRKITWR